MKPLAPIAIGAALGTLLIRERVARQAAERMAAAALETILNAIDANDEQTGEHVRRVAMYALIIADEAGFDERTRLTIERVALFHDIGKIHEALFDLVHDSSELTPEERRAVKTHPQRGANVLAPLKSFYPELSDGVLSHHEHWDGTGYPRGLRGKRIPIAARVVMLADTFDAITHSRRYRSGRSAQHAADAIQEARGTQFDPQLVDLMLSPPVWSRIIAAHRSAHRPQTRRTGKTEPLAPKVTFRWRSRTVDPAASPVGG